MANASFPTRIRGFLNCIHKYIDKFNLTVYDKRVERKIK